MPILLAAILVGLVLAMTGITLAQEESKVLDARLFLRDAARIKPSIDAIDAAYEVFLSGRHWRTDLAAARFDLDALALEVTPRSEGDAARLTRARESTSTLLAQAPLNGRAWCLLATLMVRERGLSEQAARTLQMCYDVAPREVATVERRLFLSLSNWPLLTPELRQAAIRDIGNVLPDNEFGAWMVGRVAYASVFLAPEQSSMLEAAVLEQGERFRPIYERALQTYHPAVRPR